VVFDETTSKFNEFAREPEEDSGRDAAVTLVNMLVTADELISLNGLYHDLPVLEQVCGAVFPVMLFDKPHRDLM
jgi:hypothetical protein